MRDHPLHQAGATWRGRQFAQDLADNEVWVAAAAVGASVLAPRLLPLSALVLLAFWPVRWLASGRLTRRTPADLLVALLLLMVPVTLGVTAVPDKTIPQTLRLLTGVGLFYAVLNWGVSRRRINLLTTAALAGGLGLAVFAVFSVDWAEGKLAFFPDWIYAGLPALVSDTANPNVVAGNLVLLLPLAISLPLFAWRELSKGLRMLAVASALAMTAILVLSQARGGALAMTAVLGLLATLRWRRGWLVLAAAGLGLVALVRLVGMAEIASFFSARLALGGLAGRQEIWSRALLIIRDFPLTGIGMGSFTEVVDALYPLFHLEPGKVAHAHNLFLQVAVDLGVPGLVSWLGIWLLVVFCSWRLFRAGRSRGDRLLTATAAGLLGGQGALLVHGMVEAVTWGMVRPAPLLWGLWGLSLAAWMAASHDSFNRSSMQDKDKIATRSAA
ncbi:MAG: O-antigen ligase family protein [Anaerolineales bacterium]|nr:O-antigen ligase family protein [Anaerolineales bacterium]